MADSNRMKCIPEGKYEVLMALAEAAVEWEAARNEDFGSHEMQGIKMKESLDKLRGATVAYTEDTSKLVFKKGEPASFVLDDDEWGRVEEAAENAERMFGGTD